jgi:hypothetical protein
MVIENVLAGKAAPKGWAITEVVEKGDGAWAKVCDASETSSEHSYPRTEDRHCVRANTSSPTQGTTIEHGGERAGASLSSMGWTGKRGEGLPPVWVVVHKV